MAYNLISTVTVGAGGASSIDFTSIPGTYTDLLVQFSTRGSNASVYIDTWIRVNGSSSGYLGKMVYSTTGTTTASATDSSGTQLSWGLSVAASATANTFSNGQIYIPNYAGSTNKTFSIEESGENNATAAEQQVVAGIWSNTAAVTQVSLIPSTGTFVQYSTASLYGIN